MSQSVSLQTRCCIVGGGPAGMMLGLLLARAGVDVVVLEKHADFFRDFRGDTIHPSTLELMHELGILDEFLQLPHQEVHKLTVCVNDQAIPGPDFSHLPTRCKFVAFMPQWDFLQFIARQSQRYPTFQLRLEANVTGLIRGEGNSITGVRAQTKEGELDVFADLVVGADGRHSTVRSEAGLEVIDFGVPIDVLWFRLPKKRDETEQSLGHFRNGMMMVMINRGDYWQCGKIIRKGSFENVKQGTLEAFRSEVVSVVPFVKDVIGEIDDWNKIKLLTVQINRLRQWSLPGLLCIGDSAHAMSPAGGIGVNIAIQDAVATANLLAQKLKDGTVTTHDLQKVQRRREWAVALTQRIQANVHRQLFKSGIGNDTGVIRPGLFTRLLPYIPFLRRIGGRFIGLGFQPEHVRSPKA